MLTVKHWAMINQPCGQCRWDLLHITLWCAVGQVSTFSEHLLMLCASISGRFAMWWALLKQHKFPVGRPYAFKKIIANQKCWPRGLRICSLLEPRLEGCWGPAALAFTAESYFPLGLLKTSVMCFKRSIQKWLYESLGSKHSGGSASLTVLHLCGV